MSEYEINPAYTSIDVPEEEAAVFACSLLARAVCPLQFGRINNLLYRKRRAGSDVIDLGMGNPSDPPSEMVIEAGGSARSARHGLQQIQGS
jgi:alanine-synthesizing transaminase